MITNIENVARFHGRALEGTLVSPDAAQYLEVSFDHTEFDFLEKDSATFSINTLRSNLSLPSLGLTSIHTESPVTSPREQLASTTENSFEHRRSLIVKSPFLNTFLPIPRFKYDDISSATKYENNNTSLRNTSSTLPSDDSSLSCDGTSDSDGDCSLPFGGSFAKKRCQSESHDQSFQGIRRSKRKRKPVDLRKRNLETPSWHSSPQKKLVRCTTQKLETPAKNVYHPCSERGKLRSIKCSCSTKEDSSDDGNSASGSGGSVLDEGEYEIDQILGQEINEDGQVMYLIKWKPTWEPEEYENFKSEGQGEGAWKLEKI